MSKKALVFALVGRFDRKLDATRRVRLPAEWFSLMGNPKSVVVLRDPAEKCLNLVSESIYEAQIKSLRRRSSKDAEAREELRLLEGAVEHVAVNARHCIRISDKLLSSAGIKSRGGVSRLCALCETLGSRITFKVRGRFRSGARTGTGGATRG